MRAVQKNAMASVFDRYGLQKLSELDVKQLRTLGPEVSLSDEANQLEFKSPGGHSITTPYDANTVEHHMRRLGSSKAYHAALARRLQEQGALEDKTVEQERDRAVRMQRFANTLGIGLLGAVGGGLAERGAGSKSFGVGGGALLGGLIGGTAGYLRDVKREQGPAERHIEEIAELYKEPTHVKQMKRQLSNLESEARFNRAYGYRRRPAPFLPMRPVPRGYYDPYAPYDPYDPYGYRY